MGNSDLEYIEIRESRIHNKGVFAKKDIPKGTKVIEYVGRKISKANADKIADETLEKSKGNKEHGAVYIFELNKKFDLDGNVEWNPARYINHSCNPNCEAENAKGKHIWIISLRGIKKGEEITYNYGYSIDSYEEHPCKCGGKSCPGYIVEEDKWPKLKKLLNKKQSKKQKVK